MKRYFLVSFGVLFLCVASTAPTGFSQETAAELDLEIKLLNPALLGLDSASSAPHVGSSSRGFTFGSSGATQITVQIHTTLVAVNSQAELEEFLSKNGILPDNNAQSFVYYLNHDLASVHGIAAGTKLALPALQISRRRSELSLPRQPIIALVVEPKLKQSLRLDVDSFRITLKKKKNDFAPAIADSLNSINLSVEEFYKDRVPSSGEMLEQVKAEVGTLDSILARYSRKSRSIFGKGPKLLLNTEDSLQLDLIKADLQDKVETSNVGNPNVTVTVETIKDGVEISHFIVCYASVATYKANRCDRSFSEQSSPTEQSLPQARYNFWAVKPGDARAVSDIRPIQVRWQDGQATVVQLTILE